MLIAISVKKPIRNQEESWSVKTNPVYLPTLWCEVGLLIFLEVRMQ